MSKSKHKRHAEQFSDELFWFMDAHNFDDMSDGAWWATLEGSVWAWNEKHKTHFDENETVHAYLEWKGKNK